MTDSALDRETHERSADGGDPIDDVSGVTFLGEGRPHIDDQMETVEAGRNELVLARRVKQVTSQLVGHEIIVRQILIEGSDYPVPIGRHVSIMVVVDAVGICETNQIEPILGHVLAELWFRKQTVDKSFVSFWGFVRQERLDLRPRRR